MTSIVIYTDLDGSLLDHYSYSHAQADRMLAALEAMAIPVIPVSSKTRTELISLRFEIANHHPFIIENGAAVLIPAGYFNTRPPDVAVEGDFWIKTFAKPRGHWLGKLQQLSKEFAGEFRGFSDLTIGEIASITGLGTAAARMAAAREYSEPVDWLGSPDSRQRFIQRLEENGVHILQGGRFLHLMDDCDKGVALRWLHSQYARQSRTGAPLSIAVGDSGNDIAMLETADIALIIRSPNHPPPHLVRDQRVFISQAAGPEGWAEGIGLILRTLEQTGTLHHG